MYMPKFKNQSKKSDRSLELVKCKSAFRAHNFVGISIFKKQNFDDVITWPWGHRIKNRDLYRDFEGLQFQRKSESFGPTRK